MRVLIVDDSLIHIRQLTETLSHLGHTVIGHARTGTSGVQLFRENAPELVFLDVVMPELDGLAALRLIKALDAKARVIMLTSTAGVGAKVEEALKLGATAVLAKPATAAEIERAIQRLEGMGGR